LIKTDTYTISLNNGTATWEATSSPIVISIPHDGTLKDFKGIFRSRSCGAVVRDKNVWPIVRDMLETCQAHVVRGLVSRTFIDYNRAWPEAVNYYPFPRPTYTALEDPRLAPLYLHYHKEIDRLIGGSKEKFGAHRNLLIDLHGFSTQPPDAPLSGYDLIFGTNNRGTINYGEPDRRLAEHLRSKGYAVFLPEEYRREGEMYSADHTACSHARRHGINTLQIEIASRFRLKGSVTLGKQLSLDLSAGLNALMNTQSP
jgi:N-formylglutamate amidohydrolase